MLWWSQRVQWNNSVILLNYLIIIIQGGRVYWTNEDQQKWIEKQDNWWPLMNETLSKYTCGKALLTKRKGRQRMGSEQDCIYIKKRILTQYFKSSEDEWLRTPCNEELISVDEEPDMCKDRITCQREEKLESKQMYDQY